MNNFVIYNVESGSPSVILSVLENGEATDEIREEAIDGSILEVSAPMDVTQPAVEVLMREINDHVAEMIKEPVAEGVFSGLDVQISLRQPNTNE